MNENYEDNNERLFEASQKIRETDLRQLYKEDEQAWLKEIQELYYFDPVLCEHLLEEAKKNQREIESYFIKLVSHMLKWQYQQNKQGNSWLSTIKNTSHELQMIFRDSKTLFNYYKDNYIEWYEDAIDLASSETKKSKNEFPQEFPYDVDIFWQKDKIENFLNNNAKENFWTKFKYKK